MRHLLRLSLTAAWLSVAALCFSQSPVRIDAASGGALHLVNDLPVDVVATIETKDSRVPSYGVLRIPSRGRSQARKGGSPRIVDWTPVHSRLPVTNPSGCGATTADLGPILAEAATHLTQVEISRTADAYAAVSSSRKAGGLELANWIAYESYLRDNVYRQEAVEKLAKSDPAAALEVIEQDQTEKALIATIALAGESGAALAEQERQWSREADLMQPLLDGLKDSERQLKAAVTNSAALERAGRQHGAQILKLLQLKPAAGLPTSVVRACSAPSANRDQLVLRGAPGAARNGAIALVLRFDDGTQASYPAFQMARTTDAWIVSYYWPPRAERVAVAVRGLGGAPSKDLGTIAAGRRSATAILSDVQSSRKATERKLKESRWFGRGGSGASSGMITY